MGAGREREKRSTPSRTVDASSRSSRAGGRGRAPGRAGWCLFGPVSEHLEQIVAQADQSPLRLDSLQSPEGELPKAPYLDAPLVGKPDFEQRIGDTQVRYCRIFGLLMRHFWPRARMVFVRSDPNRACGLTGPRRFTGFSDPVLSTVCPYLIRRPACTLQWGPSQLTPVRVIEPSSPDDLLSLLLWVSGLANACSLH